MHKDVIVVSILKTRSTDHEGYSSSKERWPEELRNDRTDQVALHRVSALAMREG
jgi:hypothetical protein